VAEFDDRTVISVRGDLDLDTAAALEHHAITVLAPWLGVLTIDLSYCTFMDSSGINALLKIKDQTEEMSVDFRVTDVPPNVRKVLALTHVEQQLGIRGR
jgi:anti-sigma B factor antagonist